MAEKSDRARGASQSADHREAALHRRRQQLYLKDLNFGTFKQLIVCVLCGARITAAYSACSHSPSMHPAFMLRENMSGYT